MALFVMSLFWLPPAVWFTVTGGILLVFVLSRDARLPVGVASFCLLLAILAWPVQPEIAADLFAVSVAGAHGQGDGLMQISVGRQPTTRRYTISRRAIAGMNPTTDRYVRAYYEFPFNFKKRPERVAIVGSGSGNDVAAALRMGASHVDAIEIDPGHRLSRQAQSPRASLRRPARHAAHQRCAQLLPHRGPEIRSDHLWRAGFPHRAQPCLQPARRFLCLYPRGNRRSLQAAQAGRRACRSAFTLPNESLGFKLSKILQELPGAGKPLAVRVLYDSNTTTAFIAQKGRRGGDARHQRVRRDRLHRCFGVFLAALSRGKHPDRRLAVLLHDRAHLSGQLHDCTRHGAASKLHVRAQDHRLDGPDRARLSAVLLSRLRLHAGGDQGHHRTGAASWRHLVCHCRDHRSGSGDGVPGQPDGAGEGRSADRAWPMSG